MPRGRRGSRCETGDRSEEERDDVGEVEAAAVSPSVEPVPAAAGPAGAAADSDVRRWMEHHGPELRAHLARMLGRSDDAEDVLQEVWITAFRRPPDDGPGANVRAWLYRVATNAALDRLATVRRRRAALEERGHELLPPAPAGPEAYLLGEEARARIRERVADLPRKQREAVWMRWIEGKDYGSISRRLECSEASARANVYQGLKRLRSELSDIWGQEAAR